MTLSMNTYSSGNQTGGIMAQTDFKFNPTKMKSFGERVLFPGKDFKVKKILPMVEIEGVLFVTDSRLYFQRIHNFYDKVVFNYKIENFTEFLCRRFKHRELGLQLKLTKRDKNGGSVRREETLYLCFENTEDRNMIYEKILDLVPRQCKTDRGDISQYTYQWVNGQLSNFEYLQVVNTYAQRSTLDLTQYPVFPWIIKDYESQVLDFDDTAKTFRDLSKPIGALNEERLKEFIKIYHELPEEQKYLYGTHFSCPGYVIGFLVRSQPQWMIKFQGGRFDNPNRLFKGIKKEWDSCMTNSANVKELIPEFYMDDPSFLKNQLRLDLGTRANGKRVDDVKLPKWAQNADEFLKKNREALESSYVSENLHKWLDLIFGVKQRSFEDKNMFHYVTYENLVKLEEVTDPLQRAAYEMQITEFGQMPK